MDSLARANTLVDSLFKMMRPVIVSEVRRMYDAARKRCNGKEADVLLCFQQELEQVGMWGAAEVERMRMDVIERGRCPWVQDLLDQVVDQYAGLAFVLTPTRMTFFEFGRELMLTCCRQFWLFPQLFYDRVKSAQLKRNAAEVDDIILSKLRETVSLFVHHNKNHNHGIPAVVETPVEGYHHSDSESDSDGDRDSDSPDIGGDTDFPDDVIMDDVVPVDVVTADHTSVVEQVDDDAGSLVDDDDGEDAAGSIDDDEDYEVIEI